MRKASKMVAALGLVAAMAAPAMADVSLTGFYRAKGYVANYMDYGAGTINPSADKSVTGSAREKAYVDQRWRGKLSAGDENVKAVAFFEIDSQWGDKSGAVERNEGAAIGGDSINLETKNVYLWFKIPDTSVDFTVGLQNVSDSYAGVFMGAADLAGVVTNFKFEPVAIRLGALQPWKENRADASGTALYIGEAKFSPTKDVKVGANMYFLRDGGTKWNPGNQLFNATTPASSFSGSTAIGTGVAKLYMPGVDFAVNAGMAKVSGFAFAQFGDRKYDVPGTQKTKFSGYSGDVRADLNAGPAKVFVEGLYVSGNDYNANSDKYKGIVVMDDYKFTTGSSTFSRTDMVLLLPAADSINTSPALAYDANNLGLGMVHIAAGASMDVASKTTAKLGVGYLTAAKKIAGTGPDYFNFKNKSDMGTEVNASVNYNISKGLDLTGTAAYVFLGGAYDKSKAGLVAQDAKDPYALIAKVNYAF
jgi:hypothetical protein